jgi:hypothetical protein
MVRVARRGGYVVYVYAEGGQSHHLPHCHVVWSDGETAVELPNGNRLAGDKLPAVARELVRDAMDEIVVVWNRLNPGRPVR